MRRFGRKGRKEIKRTRKIRENIMKKKMRRIGRKRMIWMKRMMRMKRMLMMMMRRSGRMKKRMRWKRRRRRRRRRRRTMTMTGNLHGLSPSPFEFRLKELERKPNFLIYLKLFNLKSNFKTNLHNITLLNFEFCIFNHTLYI